MKNIINYILGLIRSKFYGTLEITFREGVPSILRRQETIKLEEEKA